MEAEKHEAVGQRGEACLIVFTSVTLPSGEARTTYTLASGQRLRPTENPGEFVTLDGMRSFKLRR
jgi:hypothetical protein